MVDVFLEVGIVIIAATVLAFLGKFLKQPSIIAYILAGVIIGPLGLKLIQNNDIIALFSELGIVFLLFIVGLQLDVKKLKGIGSSSLLISIGQVVFTAAIGYVIARFWFTHLAALYIAMALAFSSTVIVVKLLTDKNEIATLHGRITLGVLLVQDIVAVFSLVFFSSFQDLNSLLFVASGAKMLAFFGLAVIATLFIIPQLFKFVAHSLELLFLAALSWAFAVAFGAAALGFSPASGAFIAGITLASTPYAIEISSRIRPLRDFFVTMFFVALGMQIAIRPLQAYLVPMIILSLFVVIGKPLVMLVITALSNYHKRASFLTSLALAQISEFSLVLVMLGYSLGHLSADIVALIATIATITISVSSYFIIYDEQLYHLMKPLLFWKGKQQASLEYLPETSHDVVLCGYNRIGYSILKKLRQMKKSALVVDYNPETIKHLIKRQVPCLYGDVGDIDIIARMNLKRVNMLISTVPTKEDNLLLIKRLKRAHRKAIAVVTANQIDEALELYDAGADYVILPHFIGGEHVALLVEDLTLKKLVQHKKSHIKELHKRKAMGHEHPRH